METAEVLFCRFFVAYKSRRQNGKNENAETVIKKTRSVKTAEIKQMSAGVQIVICLFDVMKRN